MSIEGKKVAVIGAGIAGLASATALAQRGAFVTVYERSEALGEVGAGLQVSPNGVAVLGALGLKEKAAKFANAPTSVKLCDMATSQQVASLSMGETAQNRWGQPFWQFHRADLLSVLVAGAYDAGVEICLGQDVKTLPTQSDLIVGADGVRSNLRQLMFDTPNAQFTGQVAWRGLLYASELPSEMMKNQATVFMGAGRHLVTYPLREGAILNFVAVEERADWAEEGWSIEDDPKNLRNAFKNSSPNVQGVLERVSETFLWGLFSHPYLPNWFKENVVLVGDACHPMLPFMAQGAVMALEDAWVLADSLDASNSIANGLASYQAKRQSRATRVQRAAQSNATVYHLRNPAAKFVAHTGLGMLSSIAPNALLGRFDWLYGCDVTD